MSPRATGRAAGRATGPRDAGLPALLASLGGIGRARTAPGTWGSLAVLPLAWLGPLACLGIAALLCALSAWALPRVVGAEADPGWIVIDEGAGQLLALAALAPLAGWGGIAWVLAGFALFRLFDILKPWPVSWAENRGGAWGVMADDLVAGALAASVLLAARWAWGA